MITLHLIGTKRLAAPRRLLDVAMLGAIAMGCRESSTDPIDRAASITAVSATQQTGIAGTAVAIPPAVAVRDASGNPVADVPITFLGPTSFDRTLIRVAKTSLDGTAVAPEWILPNRKGLATITAAGRNLPPVKFNVTVTPDAPVQATAVAGDDQVGLPGATLPASPSVLVADKYRNGVSGIRVVFAVDGVGGATIQFRSAVTNDSGVASAGVWTLGTEPRIYTVSATVSGLAFAALTYTARVNTPFAVSTIAAGGYSTCATTTNGAVYCWGLHRLLDESVSKTPVRVAGVPPLVSLTIGSGHTCGLTADGTAYCWGGNESGQTGTGSVTFTQQPSPVAGGLAFLQLSAGAQFTCGLTKDRRAYCWGANTTGQLGDGTRAPLRSTPTAVQYVQSFATIASGSQHACALTPEGKAFCWGRNDSLQVGATTSEMCPMTIYDFYYGSYVGQGTCSTTPVAVLDAPALAAVSASTGGVCGLTDSGDAVCWGHSQRARPLGGLRFAKIIATADGLCGLTPNGAAYCSRLSVLTPVGQSPAFSDIAAGIEHQCAIETSLRYAYCWGTNSTGQLGVGTLSPSSIPLPVAKPES